MIEFSNELKGKTKAERARDTLLVWNTGKKCFPVCHLQKLSGYSRIKIVA